MKLDIKILPLGDHFVVITKNKKTNQLVDTFKLNEVGADMFKLLCEGKDENAISESISLMYDAPIDQVKKDVSKFLSMIKRKGIV